MRRSLVLLLAIPLTLTVAVPDWMYSNPSVIDAWVYNGFFRHLPTYATTMFPSTYYGTRLGWILPGYVAYHVFEPRTAAFVLHLTVYLLATGSMYGIVRDIAGSSRALFVAAAFGWYMPVVRALGSDYVDGPVIAYGLLATLLALRADGAWTWWRTVCSGIATGAMLHSNVGAAFLLPSIFVWFVPAPRDLHWTPLATRVLLWAGGIVLCTAGLALFSVSVGGPWNFFAMSFRWMRSQGLANPFQPPPAPLLSSAPWLLLPAATAVAALVVMASKERRQRLTEGQVRALIAFASLALLFAIWDFVGPGAVLYWPFYSSWLLPWSFIVIGGVITPSPAVTRAHRAVMVVSAGAVLASLVWPEHVMVPVPAGVGLAIVSAALAIAAAARRRVVAWPLVAVTLVCLHGWLSATAWYARVDDRGDAFRAIDAGVRIIERYVTRDEPRFLLTSEGRLGHYIQGLTSVYLWGYTIASPDFLEITPQQVARIRPEHVVIVVDERRDTAAKFDEVFAPYRLRARVLGAEQVQTQHGPLYLTFVEPQPLASE